MRSVPLALLLSLAAANLASAASYERTDGAVVDPIMLATIHGGGVHPYSGPDLGPTALLTGSALWGADLQFAALSGADLSGSSIDDAILDFADLAGVDLSPGNLTGTSLVGADLSLADLTGVNVRSVLQFARDERTDKWPCRLDDILRRSAHLAQPLADPHGARIHVQLPAEPVWVDVNPIQVEQAVVNLVRNAIEAGSGHVQIALDTAEDEGVALVQVDDDGPGIPEEERVRIFEPFYTTRRDAGGTGLGLSVVHGIATEHDGQLKIETNESGGMAALLELPRVPPPVVPYGDDREKAED